MTLIAIHATPEEVAKIQLLKAYYGRKTNSDLLRYLLQSASQKILQQKVSIETLHEPQEINHAPNCHPCNN